MMVNARGIWLFCAICATLVGNTHGQSITSVLQLNSPLSGGLTITLGGTGFGATDLDPTVSVGSGGSQPLCSVSYISATQVLCGTAFVSSSTFSGIDALSGVDFNIQLGGGFPSTIQNQLTFDAPVVTQGFSDNIPQSSGDGGSGALITIHGVNFGATDFSGVVRIGNSACASTIWVSNSQVKCIAPDGDMIGAIGASTGRYWPVKVTVGAIVGTRGVTHASFSYDSPVISVNSNNWPLTAGREITMLGMNFGRWDPTPTAHLIDSDNGNDYIGLTTSWTTYTSVRTQLNSLGNTKSTRNSLAITVSAVVGTRKNSFTFNSPVITSYNSLGANAPGSAGQTVTISGLNFGYVAPSPTAMMEDTMCGTTSWSSQTTIQCQSAGASSGAVGIAARLTVASLVGTAGALFTFDSPVVSFSLIGFNVPKSGGASVTISGLNFANKDYTPVMSIISAGQCDTTAWSSATTVSCASPVGYYSGVPIKTTITSVIGTFASQFSYDAPVVSFMTQNGPPSVDSHSITLSGMAFQDSSPSSPSIRIGGTLCGEMSYTSATSINCQPGVSYGGSGKSVALTINAVVSTRVKSFTFDLPVITDHNAVNSALTQGTSLTLTGINFGLVDTTQTAMIYTSSSNEVCATTLWTSATNILCGPPPTSGGTGKNIAVTVTAVVGTRLAGFSYDAPVVTYSPNQNLIATATSTVTVQGLNFGGLDPSPTAVLADEVCGTTAWTSSSTIKCGNPANGGIVGPGTKSSYNTILTVSANVGTRFNMFSFDGPTVSSAIPYNTPTTAGASVTVTGLNFGYPATTPTAQLDASQCLTTSWTSDTTVTCAQAAGYGTTSFLSTTVNNVVGTAFSLLTFDAPAVSFSDLYNQASNGRYYFSVTGLNFGGTDVTTTSGLGPSSCVSTTWTSATQVSCSMSHYGLGPKRAQAVTIGAIVGTSALWFTFDSPVLTAFSPSNVGTRFYASVTLLGVNFGAEDATSSLAFGSNLCSTATWTSGSTITCFSVKNGFGTTTGLMYIAGLAGTVQSLFTFDAAIPSFSTPQNVATTGSGTITLTGSNFAAQNYTPTAQIGDSICSTSAWTSTTTTKCYVPAGVGAGKRVVLTLGAVAATKLKLFTYDAPVPTTLRGDTYSINGPTSGGFSVTIAGLNFGSINYTPTSSLITIGTCATTSWTTATTLLCEGSSGYGVAAALGTTISALVGTLTEAFTFDAPVVSYFVNYNMATTGSGTVTMRGFNFGSVDTSLSSSIGSTSCATSSWTSASAVSCLGQSGTSAVYPKLTVQTISGTMAELFSYDAPVVTQINDVNGPTMGGTSLTVTGVNFAASDETPSIILASNICKTASWLATTSLVCQNDYENTPERAKIALTISGLVSTSQYLFTFDGAIITHTAQFNGAQSGGTSVSISGTDFGGVDLTPSLFLGSTACGTVAWTTSTSIQCASSYGQALGLTAHLYQKFSGMKVISSFANVGTGLRTTSKPSDISVVSSPSHATITIQGLDFGTVNYTPTTMMINADAEGACTTTSWSSSTTIQCGSASGSPYYPIATPFAMQAASSFATATAVFTYDSPVISQSSPSNAPTTLGGTITIIGVNFGNMAPTLTVALESTLCTTTSWTSGSVVQCVSTPGASTTGVGSGKFQVLTLASMVGTVQDSFTYDAAVLTLVANVNGPSSGSFFVTMSGMNFAAANFTPSAVVGSTQCQTAIWVSATTVTCELGAGSGGGLDAVLTLDGLVGTRASAFSYDAPSVSFDVTANLPTSQGSMLSLHGFNFGFSDLSQTATIGDTACSSTLWVSTTEVTCLTNLGSGTGHSLTMSVSAVVGTKPETFTYDSPVVSFLAATNAPISGTNSLTVLGLNYAGSDTTPTVTVGNTQCGTSVWTTTTSVICELAPGLQDQANTLNAITRVSTLVGSLQGQFSYDSPVISWTHSYNAPTTAGASITLSGTGFGYIDFTPTARVGSTLCQTTSWATSTKVDCVPPQSGGDVSLHVVMTMASLVGTRPASFSYDAPVLSRTLASNAATCSGASITLNGVNFGQSDPSPTVQIGSGSGTKCGSTVWVTTTSVTCQMTAYGTGKKRHVVISLGKQTGSRTNSFSYDSPVVTHIGRPNKALYNSNGATSSGTTITMNGINFGSLDFTPTARVGLSNCPTAAWTAGTSLKCLAPSSAAFISSGGVRQTHVSLDLQTLIGTLSEAFTYDAPVLSLLDRPNAAATGGSIISLSGMSFGVHNTSPTATLGSSICASSQWISTTMVACVSSVGHDRAVSAVLTIDSLVGTRVSKFTFDGPVVTDSSVNAPTTGAASVSVLGLNFATEDVTGTIQIGSTTCTTSTWTTSTALKCLASGGTAAGHTIAVSINSAIGTFAGEFSYDSPLISVTNANIPPSTGISLTLLGTNFGVSGQTMSARVGSTICQTTAFNSQTSIICHLQTHGYGAGVSQVVTITSLVATNYAVFTYDTPVLTSIVPGNHPSSDGSSLTILGTNFMALDMTPTVLFGSTHCDTVSWTTTTSIACESIEGVGRSITTSITVNGMVGTELAGFSYDAPTVSYVLDMAGAPSGGFSVTLSGSNFGYSDFSASVKIGGTMCTTTSWYSRTALACHGSAGFGNDVPVSVIVDEVTGSLQNAFTYTGPILSHFEYINSPTSGGQSITVQGENFGVSDPTPTVVIGDVGASDTQRCLTTSWNTVTSVTCAATRAGGQSQTVRMDVGDNVGTAAGLFSYDSPILSQFFDTNAPTSGFTSVTIIGVNFGNYDFSLSTRVGSSACGTTSWLAASSIVCLSDNYGSDSGQTISLTVEQNVGTAREAFSYDAPVTSFLQTMNAAPSAAVSVTLSGFNFAQFDLTATTNLGFSSCGTSSWNTATSVQCKVSQGSAGQISVGLVHFGVTATAFALFSYDSPVITRSSQYNGAGTGAMTLTVSGSNFGVLNLTPSVKIGKTVCRTTTWSSLTSLLCNVAPGYGSDMKVVASVSKLAGTIEVVFTYDAPIVTLVSHRNMPTTAGASLTIYGTNFGFEDTTPLPKVGSTRCATTSWNSETTLVCKTSGGVGTQLSFALSLGVLVGTHTHYFTYDAPVLTFPDRPNAPTSGAASLTLHGFNFVPSDGTLTAAIGVTQCSTSSWTSATALLCTSVVGGGTPYTSFVDTSSDSELVGTGIQLFTYDAPIISRLQQPNAGMAGATSITLVGANFAADNLTPTINIGSSSCTTAMWTSSTFVKCHTKDGADLGHTTVLTVAALSATSFKSFSYDSPVLTYVNRFNTALTNGVSLTINGVNFGLKDDYSPTIMFGSTYCATTSWTANTALFCSGVQGEGIQQTLVMPLVSHVGTGFRLFSYDAPVISIVERNNSPATAGTIVTLSGVHFGVSDLSVTATIGTTACQTTGYTSMTSVSCLVPQGAGSFIQASLTVANNVGTMASTYSYDAPIVTFVDKFNAPSSSGAQVTISGFNFGFEDFTPTVHVGKSACSTTTWTALTSATCTVEKGHGDSLNVAISINSVVGTRLLGFTYDSPVVSDNEMFNAPTTSGMSVTVSGLNFGSTDFTATVQIKDVSCPTSSWQTASSVKCLSPANGGFDTPLEVIIESHSGTGFNAFTFDSPVMSQVQLWNSAASGGISVTVRGINFGAYSLASTDVMIGVSSCTTKSWISATQMVCLASSGTGRDRSVKVDVMDVVGTVAFAFSYDSPVVSQAKTANVAASGSASVTVSGLNFGSMDNTVSVLLGVTVCETSSWISQTTVTCLASPGTDKDLQVAVVPDANLGAAGAIFSYNAPVVTKQTLDNAPASGGSIITLSGSNFGTSDTTAVHAIGGTACAESIWVSTTSAKCSVAAGTGVSLATLAGSATLVGTFSSSFSFDSPVVSKASHQNGPSTSGAMVTVEGVHFGIPDPTATVTLGLTSCMTSTWTSNTAAACMHSYGSGAELIVGLSITGNTGTAMRLFSFDAPALSNVNTANAPTSAGAVVTVSGTNLGVADLSASIRLGLTTCASTIWVSASQVLCQPSAGTGEGLHASLTLDSVVGTVAQAFSYDSPVVSLLSPVNAPATGMTDIVVSGDNFGTANLPKDGAFLRLGKTVCMSNYWISYTSLQCSHNLGVGSGLPAEIDLSGQIGSIPAGFTYDSPVVTFLNRPNAPTTGSTSLTVRGTNFGPSDYSATFSIGTTSCGTTSWRTDTLVYCTASPGVRPALHLAADVGGVMGTGDVAFTYDAPLVTVISAPNGPTLTGASITIEGSNFGPTDSSVTASIGGTKCASSIWVTNSAVKCVVPSGSGSAQSSTVSVTGLFEDFPASFTFDAPVVTYVMTTLTNQATSSTFSVTLTGFNFGVSNLSPEINFGGKVCDTAGWTTYTAMLCHVGAGAGRARVSVAVDSVTGTGVAFFTYDSPIITLLSVRNSAASGGASITVAGVNFGPEDFTPSARIGDTSCTTFSWTSSTASMCLAPPGAGTDTSLSVSLSAVVGTGHKLFTYDSPVLTFAGPTNNPATGGGVVTVVGLNFGVSDANGMAGISPTLCDGTEWVSDTSVACSVAAGIGKNSMTMSLMSNVGTLYSSFTFDSPAVTRLHVPNAAPTAGATITLMGTNFGTSESSSTATIAGVNCGTTYWLSATQMVCTSQVSLGLRKTLALEVAGITGTFVLAFSYDSPVVTSTLPYNMPSSAGGATSVTLVGTNFGAFDVKPTAYLGETACVGTKWISSTTTHCNPAPGIGAGVDVNVMLQRSAVGTEFGQTIYEDYKGGVAAGFTYDTPVITTVSIQNGPMAGGAVLTMTGSNFGVYDAGDQQQGIVAGQPCDGTQWISNTAISCQTPSGAGLDQHVGLLVSEKNIGTLAAVFSYDRPIVSAIAPTNGPTLGGAQLTINGLNLGTDLASVSAEAYLNTKACETADAHGRCLKFMSGKISKKCETTTFVSATTLVCQMPPVEANLIGGTDAESGLTQGSNALMVQVTKAGSTAVQGIGESLIYDEPVLTHLVPCNGPPSGGAILTMYGKNFGHLGLKMPSFGGNGAGPFIDPEPHLDEDAKDSIVTFRQPPRFEPMKDASPGPTRSIQLYKGVGSTEESKMGNSFEDVFSYDAPVVNKIIPANAPTNGGQILVLEGMNFGDGKLAAKTEVYVGGVVASDTKWISESSIQCVTPPGLGIAKEVAVDVNEREGQAVAALTYDAPVISAIEAPEIANGDKPGNFLMQILGEGFGLPDNARRSGQPPKFGESEVLISVGDAYCYESKLISPTSVSCRTIAAASPETAQRVSITVGGNVNTYFQKFPYGTICPLNCSYAQGQGECASSGLCQCKNVPNTDRVYQGADCSLDYCLGSTTLTASKGTITDHTELRYLYIPWYKTQVGSASCGWTIQPNAGQVRLAINKMDIHPDDSLLVYDGKDSSSALLANLSGTLPVPDFIYSTGGALYVTLRSPLPVATLRTGYTGFEARYESQPDGCPLGCSAHLGLGTCVQNSCQCATGWRGDGCEIGYTALSDSFDPGLDDDMWLDRRGAVFSFGCGQSSGNALFFQGSNSRYVVTESLDLRHGGYVSFYIRVGSDGAVNATCELVDDGEEVELQWASSATLIDKSDTKTANWKSFPYPFGTYSATAYQNFRLVQAEIPKEAYGDSVYLRWIQPKHDMVRGKDTWALDTVKVVTPYKCETGINNVECSGRGSCFATNECQCFDGFVGPTCEDACHWNYWHEKVCGCAAPIDPYLS